jgi:hypothetical protein
MALKRPETWALVRRKQYRSYGTEEIWRLESLGYKKSHERSRPVHRTIIATSVVLMLPLGLRPILPQAQRCITSQEKTL